MKIRYFPLLSLLLFLSLSFITNRSFADASDRAWQTSVEPVTLSLRNKLLDDAYTVEFIVKASGTDHKWSYIARSEPNAWNQPRFPVDFKGPKVDFLKPQEYSWSAHILEDDSKAVLGGRFIYPNFEFASQEKASIEKAVQGQLTVEFDRPFADRYVISMTLLPEQQQGGDFITCDAFILIYDLRTDSNCTLYSTHFSLPVEALQPFVEVIHEPDYRIKVRPGMHLLRLKTDDYLHPIPMKDYSPDFERGFAFADFYGDGSPELLVAKFMAGQQHRTAYSVYEIVNGGWESHFLDPIEGGAFRCLDTSSVINLQAKTIQNHCSGSAIHSVTSTWRLHTKEDADPYLPFTGRDQYLLTRESGVEFAEVGSSLYMEIERVYGYWFEDGQWKRQTVKKVEDLKGN